MRLAHGSARATTARRSPTASDAQRLTPCPRLVPQIRHNLQAFLAGGVASLSLGVYWVWKDVIVSSDRVQDRLTKVGTEMVSTSQALEARVVALEGEVRMLKGSIEAAKVKQQDP